MCSWNVEQAAACLYTCLVCHVVGHDYEKELILFMWRGLQAAWAAIQVYLELDRAPASAANAASAQDAADAKLSPEELKRLKQKRRKVHSIENLRHWHTTHGHQCFALMPGICVTTYPVINITHTCHKGPPYSIKH